MRNLLILSTLFLGLISPTWADLSTKIKADGELNSEIQVRLLDAVESMMHDVEQHRWESIISKINTSGYKDARLFYGDRWQAIATVLQVDYGENHISPGQTITRAALQKIKRIKVDLIEVHDVKNGVSTYMTIDCTIELQDGSTLQGGFNFKFQHDQFTLQGFFG